MSAKSRDDYFMKYKRRQLTGMLVLLRALFEMTIVTKPLIFATEEPENKGFINNDVNSTFKVCLFIT